MINKFKQWILNRKFVRVATDKASIVQMDVDSQYWKEKVEEAKQFTAENLGAIKRYEQLKLRDVNELADKKLNDLLSSVDLANIVTYDKTRGLIYIGGVKAEEGQLTNLKSEAEALSQFSLWKLIQETPKELAQRALFVDSESLDGLRKGRSILYTLSTQQNILNILKSFVPKK